MKKLAAFGLFVLMIAFISCKKDEKASCDYQLPESFTNDTTFFISFKINNQQYRYYQVGNLSSGSYPSIPYKDGLVLNYYSRVIGFTQLISDEDYFKYLHPAVRLYFWKTAIVIDSPEEISKQYYRNHLSDEVNDGQSFRYTSANYFTDSNDSLYMNGVGIDVHMTFRTSDVIERLEGDHAKIDSFFEEGSYFEITEKTQVCDDYFLLKGKFATKFLSGSDTIKLKNGEFYFITE